MLRNTTTDKKEEIRIQYNLFRPYIPSLHAGMRRRRFEPAFLYSIQGEFLPTYLPTYLLNLPYIVVCAYIFLPSRCNNSHVSLFRDDIPLSDHRKTFDGPCAMQSPSARANDAAMREHDDHPTCVPDESGLTFTQVEFIYPSLGGVQYIYTY